MNRWYANAAMPSPVLDAQQFGMPGFVAVDSYEAMQGQNPGWQR
jgi:hypothetical protein